MMLVILNGEYRIAEESNKNLTLCSAEEDKSEINGKNWVKYEMIRYKININSTLTDNLYTTVEKYDSLKTNGK